MADDSIGSISVSIKADATEVAKSLATALKGLKSEVVPINITAVPDQVYKDTLAAFKEVQKIKVELQFAPVKAQVVALRKSIVDLISGGEKNKIPITLGYKFTHKMGHDAKLAIQQAIGTPRIEMLIRWKWDPRQGPPPTSFGANFTGGPPPPGPAAGRIYYNPTAGSTVSGAVPRPRGAAPRSASSRASGVVGPVVGAASSVVGSGVASEPVASAPDDFERLEAAAPIVRARQRIQQATSYEQLVRIQGLTKLKDLDDRQLGLLKAQRLLEIDEARTLDTRIKKTNRALDVQREILRRSERYRTATAAQQRNYLRPLEHIARPGKGEVSSEVDPETGTRHTVVAGTVGGRGAAATEPSAIESAEIQKKLEKAAQHLITGGVDAKQRVPSEGELGDQALLQEVLKSLGVQMVVSEPTKRASRGPKPPPTGVNPAKGTTPRQVTAGGNIEFVGGAAALAKLRDMIDTGLSRSARKSGEGSAPIPLDLATGLPVQPPGVSLQFNRQLKRFLYRGLTPMGRKGFVSEAQFLAQGGVLPPEDRGVRGSRMKQPFLGAGQTDLEDEDPVRKRRTDRERRAAALVGMKASGELDDSALMGEVEAAAALISTDPERAISMAEKILDKIEKFPGMDTAGGALTGAAANKYRRDANRRYRDLKKTKRPADFQFQSIMDEAYAGAYNVLQSARTGQAAVTGRLTEREIAMGSADTRKLNAALRRARVKGGDVRYAEPGSFEELARHNAQLVARGLSPMEVHGVPEAPVISKRAGTRGARPATVPTRDAEGQTLTMEATHGAEAADKRVRLEALQRELEALGPKAGYTKRQREEHTRLTKEIKAAQPDVVPALQVLAQSEANVLPRERASEKKVGESEAFVEPIEHYFDRLIEENAKAAKIRSAEIAKIKLTPTAAEIKEFEDLLGMPMPSMANVPPVTRTEEKREKVKYPRTGANLRRYTEARSRGVRDSAALDYALGKYKKMSDIPGAGGDEGVVVSPAVAGKRITSHVGRSRASEVHPEYASAYQDIIDKAQAQAEAEAKAAKKPMPSRRSTELWHAADELGEPIAKATRDISATLLAESAAQNIATKIEEPEESVKQRVESGKRTFMKMLQPWLQQKRARDHADLLARVAAGPPPNLEEDFGADEAPFMGYDELQPEAAPFNYGAPMYYAGGPDMSAYSQPSAGGPAYAPPPLTQPQGVRYGTKKSGAPYYQVGGRFTSQEAFLASGGMLPPVGGAGGGEEGPGGPRELRVFVTNWPSSLMTGVGGSVAGGPVLGRGPGQGMDPDEMMLRAAQGEFGQDAADAARARIERSLGGGAAPGGEGPTTPEAEKETAALRGARPQYLEAALRSGYASGVGASPEESIEAQRSAIASRPSGLQAKIEAAERAQEYARVAVETSPARAVATATGQVFANLPFIGGRSGILARQRESEAAKSDLSQLTDKRDKYAAGLMELQRQQKAMGPITDESSKTQQKAFAKVGREIKSNEETVKRYNVLVGDAADKSAKASRAVAGVADVVRSFAGGVLGTITGQILFQAALGGSQALVAGFGATLGPVIERMLGFQNEGNALVATMAQTTRAAGGATKQTVAQAAAQTNLSKATFDTISAALEQRVAIEAGNKAFEEQNVLIAAGRNAARQQQQAGLPEGVGAGLFQTTGGTNILGVQTPFGGQRPFEELLRERLAQVPSAEDALSGGGIGIGQLRVGVNNAPLEVRIQQRAKALDDTLRDLNDQFKGTGLQWVSSTDDMAASTDDATHALITAGVQLTKGQLAQEGISLARPSAGLTTPAIQRAIALAQERSQRPDPEVLLQALQERAIPALQYGIQQGLQNQLTKFIPANIATQQLVNPITPYGTSLLPSGGGGVMGAALSAAGIGTGGVTGLNVGGEQQFKGVPIEVTATFMKYRSEAQAAIDAVKSKAAEGEAQLLKLGVPSSVIENLRSISGRIQEISMEQRSLQLDLQYTQYNRQLYLARRQLSDLAGLTDRSGASQIGSLQRLIQLEGRRQTALGLTSQAIGQQSNALALELAQRQINFQRAIAGFTAPGTTPEERAARIEEAKIEADYAQKQLDFQKEQFELAKAQFTLSQQQFAQSVALQELEQARAYQDQQASIAELQKSFAVTIQVAGLEELKGTLTAEQQTIAAELEVYKQAGTDLVNAQAQMTTDLLTQTGEFTKELVAKVNSVFSQIALNYRNIMLGMPPVGSAHPRGGMGGPLPASELASGFLGNISGATHMVVGEAGTETVAVIKNPREFMDTITSPMPSSGGITYITITVSGNTVRDDRDLDDLAARVAARVETAMGRKASIYGLRTSR